MPCSYWRPGLPDGRALLAATPRSAPGRGLEPVAGAPPPNQPQPASRADVDTASKPSQRLLLIMSLCSAIAVFPCSKPDRLKSLAEGESKIDPCVVAAYL